MLKRYTFWLVAAILFQALTAGVHLLSFVVSPEPGNETERQIHDLTHTYYADMGAGFHRSFWNLFTALSTCYPLLCLLGALTMGYLLFKHTEPAVMKPLIGMHAAIFGICLLVMIFFAFLPPILMTGLIFINLLAAFIVCPKLEVNLD